MKLIIEGVETAPQTQWLRDDCTQYLQGFHFGRPDPPAEIEGRLFDRQ